MPAKKRIIMIAAVMATLVALSARGEEGYYTEKPMFLPAPDIGTMAKKKSWNIKNFGPVGIGIDLVAPGFTMKITTVEKGSPADKTGKLKPGQIIESINGQILKNRDPRIILGDIITEAEAGDGVVKLEIKDEGTVTVKVPVMGRYSPKWPLKCKKSDTIVRNLANLLAKQEKPSWGSALFMLSTGEEQDLEVVRKWFSNKESIGTYPWHAGYLGIAVCEYYLRTGDKSVLPAIEKMCVTLNKTMYNGGWSGRGQGSRFTYGPGTGQLHAAGVHCITFLQMAKMCGASIDDYMFRKSLKTFYRFAGHENVPYGDSWPEGGFRDNGKSAGLAVAMSAAAQLTPEGERSIYAKARDTMGMKSFYATNWFHSAHTGGGIGEIWHNAAMSMMFERRPVQYRSFLDTRRWVMELSRRWDGSIGIAGITDQYDSSASEGARSWGNYFALTYTIPRKKLVVFGAPKTTWCKSYRLPVRPWGREADDAFVQTEPVTEGPGRLSMSDLLREEVHTDSSLPFFNRIAAADVEDDTLWKYLKHPEIGLRISTMKSIVDKGRADFVLPLLKSKDPRDRHAGLLAITGMFKGSALPADKLTPEMFELAGKMIENPDESLWVVQQALLAISRADSRIIAKHKDTILNYMGHEDWFLRERAIEALLPICTDPAHCRSILPKMLKTFSEFTNKDSLRPMRSIGAQLGRAAAEVKTYALEELKKAFLNVPPVMKFPGGHTMNGGPEVVRSEIADPISGLHGGSAFLNAQPMRTLKFMLSSDKGDMYRFSLPPKPNKALEGSWLLLSTPKPVYGKSIDSIVGGYQNQLQKNPKITKGWGVLEIMNGGKLKAARKNLSGCFWSGDMFVYPAEGKAYRVLLRKAGGFYFLLIESFGEPKKAKKSEAGEPEDDVCEPGYYLHVRAIPGERGKGRNGKWSGTAIRAAKEGE